MPDETGWVNTVHLDDVDEQAGMLTGWKQEYQQLGCGRFSGTLSSVNAGEFTLIRETTNKALHETVMPPGDTMVMSMCLAGENAPRFNGKLIDQNSLLIMDGRRSHDIRTKGDLELLGVVVNRDHFFFNTCEQDARIADAAIKSSITQLAPGAADMLRQYFIMISHVLQNRSDPLSARLSPRMLAAGVLSNISLAVSLSNPDQFSAALPQHKRRHRISQEAIDYMRKNAGEEIGILDVCAAVHVSRRTLQYCFEERLGMSPLQYLKALRLNQARRQLKHLMQMQVRHCNEHTIANIAALCGFNHASHFASDYKRMFGQLPSQIKV